jgi:PIN domain nuclease of toxin-antitoxin system
MIRHSPQVRELIQDEGNELLVSAASAWEIATQCRLGKPDIGRDAVARFDGKRPMKSVLTLAV